MVPVQIMKEETQKGEYLGVMLRSAKTIFSTKDAALLWGDSDRRKIDERLRSYANSGKLLRVRRGLYAKDKNYDKLELATKIYTPAYISFETVLARAGVIFQYYSQIFVASYTTREISVNGQNISYRKMKESILTNKMGLIRERNYQTASPERAFLDVLYTNGDYHFDNLSSLNWEYVFELIPLYENKSLRRRALKHRDEISRDRKNDA